MNARKTLILALVSVALLAVALWYSASRRASEHAALQEPALPGLLERLPEVAKVTVTAAGNKVVATLERTDTGWRLAERDFAADADALRQVLLELAEARRVAAKTARPDLYPRLGVEDLAAEDARGVQLTIEGGGEPLAVILGQNAPRGVGTYMRIPGEAQSWLIDRNVAVEKSTAGWLDRDLLDIAPERIARVTVEAGQDRVEIVASEKEQGDFVLANLPKGREPQSEFVADATAGFLQGLRIDDVAPASERGPGEAARRARFHTRDGLDIEVTSFEVDGKPWAQFGVRLDEGRALAWIEAEQAREKTAWEARQASLDKGKDKASGGSEGEAPAKSESAADAKASATEEVAPETPLAVRDPAADREQRLAALRAEVERLAARFEGRSFQLPGYKAGNLNRRLEDYLKPKG